MLSNSICTLPAHITLVWHKFPALQQRRQAKKHAKREQNTEEKGRQTKPPRRFTFVGAQLLRD